MEQRTTIHIVDADPRNRAAFSRAVFNLGHHAEVYSDIAELCQHRPTRGVILAQDNTDAGGIDALIQAMSDSGAWLPVIAMAAEPGLDRVVAAMRAGALDYISQPVEDAALDAAITRVSEEAENQAKYRRRAVEARLRISMLSNREREVLDRLTQGCSNKDIARDLEISPRTVEIHRGNMMDKLGARHAAEAVRLKLEASLGSWMH